MSKILIVEDDLSFANDIKQLLTDDQYRVEISHTGFDALQLVVRFKYDLVLLDWNLPDVSGLEVCKNIRSLGLTVPVVFLTGQEGVSFLERAFECGANDFIEKQADLREFIARIRAVLRKKVTAGAKDVRVGNAVLNTKLRYLTINQSRINLTITETSLLEFLMSHVGEAFSANELFEAIWDSTSDSNFETVRVHINVIRKKIVLAGEKNFIKTLSTSGYTIDADAL